ncbi:MAG: CBS domain-containing protein [Anaerolineae bacterium]|nr:CBS domain-containing protein [Anaerolineae bacterium]
MVKLILTHENADCDAVASQLAAHILDPESIPVLSLRLNRNVREFLALYGDRFPFVEPGDLRRRRVEHVTIVDTQSVRTVRGMRPTTPITFIDHHGPARDDMPDYWRFTGDPVGANVTLLGEQLRARGVALSPVEATLMLLGLYEDTGALTYGTTTPRDAHCAAWLMEQGADLDVVRRFMAMPMSDDQHKLFDRLLENAETLDVEGHPVVVATAAAPEMVEELSTVAHRLRDMLEPAGLFMLVELKNPDRLQLVARSTTDEVDVSQVAEQFGGGGHRRAAAALVRDRTMAEARAQLIRALAAAVQPRATVGDLMSYGVLTVDADETAEAVEQRMRRTGHEGYPVLRGSQLVGLVTRHAVDRAIDHGLGDTPVRELMKSGAVTVHPGDTVGRLRRVMIESGWGQVPVINGDGDLLGVVTRTDLINQWSGVSTARRAEMAALLEGALTPDAMAMVRAVSTAAAGLNMGLYVVGGFVRDLLLGVPGKNDIDFVVEGGAIKLVQRLCARFGGHYVSHERFGTAKWQLTGGEYGGRPGVPKVIDFATARDEFYEHPTALPTVHHSSIKLDLHRRDFTINTLALRLAPPPLGQLLDFWGGERDLQNKVIRALHSLSFVDDPTRMLRAARLEQRLGFTIEPRTLELIGSALPMLDRVSGARIRHELEAILAEARPEMALARLDELGVLAQIHPALGMDDWLCAAMAALRAARMRPAWPALADPARGANWWELPYFMLMTLRLAEADQRAVCRRLRVKRRTVEGVVEARRVYVQYMPALETHQRPSELARWLAPLGDEGLAALWAAAGEAAREPIAAYAARLREVRPVTTGEDLKALGLEPGPCFRWLLGRLRDAWLDGEVSDAAGERALLGKLIDGRAWECGEEKTTTEEQAEEGVWSSSTNR